MFQHIMVVEFLMDIFSLWLTKGHWLSHLRKFGQVWWWDSQW